MLIVLDILSFKTEHRRIIAYKSAMTMPWQRFCTYDGDSITLRKELFLFDIFFECLEAADAWKFLLRQPIIVVTPKSISYRLPPSSTSPVLSAETGFTIFPFKIRVFSRSRKTTYIRDGCGICHT